jgi:hypothetical protein
LEKAARKLLERYKALDGPNGQTAYYAMVKHAAPDWQALADALNPPPACFVCYGRKQVPTAFDGGWRDCRKCGGTGVLRRR